jgi:hypothetical protein
MSCPGCGLGQLIDLNRLGINVSLFERLQACPQIIANSVLSQLQHLPWVNQVRGAKTIQLN